MAATPGLALGDLVDDGLHFAFLSAREYNQLRFANSQGDSYLGSNHVVAKASDQNVEGRT